MRRDWSGQSRNFSLNNMVSMFSFTLPNSAQSGLLSPFKGSPPVVSATITNLPYYWAQIWSLVWTNWSQIKQNKETVSYISLVTMDWLGFLNNHSPYPIVLSPDVLLTCADWKAPSSLSTHTSLNQSRTPRSVKWGEMDKIRPERTKCEEIWH